MPNIKVKYIIDENGDRVAPVTHIDAVRDSSGNGLSEILEDKPDATDLSAVATSGDYKDLENTPTSESAAQDGTDLSLVTTGEKYIWNNKANNSTMIGASSSDAGTSGLVPAPVAGDQVKFLKGNGVWTVPTYGDINYSVNTSSNVSGAVSVDGTIPVHVLTLSGNVSSVSLSANPPVGHSCHIIFASATAYTIAIAHHSTDRICPEAKNVLLEVSAGGYIEVDFFNVDNKIYVRGV